MFGLAGLPELRKVMHESHPSSLRIFNEVVLERLSADEVNRVIDLCLNEANRSNAVAKSIADDGRYLLGTFSEGYSGLKVLVQHRYRGQSRNQGVAHGPLSTIESHGT